MSAAAEVSPSYIEEASCRWSLFECCAWELLHYQQFTQVLCIMRFIVRELCFVRSVYFLRLIVLEVRYCTSFVYFVGVLCLTLVVLKVFNKDMNWSTDVILTITWFSFNNYIFVNLSSVVRHFMSQKCSDRIRFCLVVKVF